MNSTPTDAHHADAARVVKVQDAKTRLSSLLREVEAGGEFTIARGKRPVARLVPASAETERHRPMGFLRYRLPDTFFDELPEDELRAWGE